MNKPKRQCSSSVERRDRRITAVNRQPRAVRFEQRGRFTVAVALSKVPPLTTEVVERTRSTIRRRR